MGTSNDFVKTRTAPRSLRAACGTLCAVAALAAFAALPFAGEAGARPLRGSAKWSILLCTFSDGPSPPAGKDPAFFRDMFINRGAGGLADYWDAISLGSLNVNGSVVKGWYRESLTVAQAQAKAGGPNPRRGELVTDCVEAARTSPTDPYTVPADHSVAVITHPSVDFYGGGGRAFVNVDVDVGGLGHELGHGLGLDHSFSDDPTYRNVSWAAIGEYDDPWDVMSYANVFGMATARFGGAGPGLNAHHMDRLGWLPRDRIRTFGADGLTYGTLTLAALNRPDAAGDLLVRVPLDPADPFHYLTVEFRRKQGWDAGIPADIVLIHEVKPVAPGSYRTFLLRERGGGRAPVQTVTRGGLTVTVDPRSGAIGPDQALVTVSSDMAVRCLQGFVWREATPDDKVCVPPDVRTRTRNENAQAASRRQPGGGPFGPDTCRQGFVWREAVPNDHVCVTPDIRTQARADNAQAGARRNPARFVYGPNTCAQGFVWREADTRDWVCVPPERRARVRADNAQAAARRQPGGGPFGPDTCRQGFVWREAFPGDHVCVEGSERTRAAQENAAASSRLARPGA
jgi:hypothetical protein